MKIQEYYFFAGRADALGIAVTLKKRTCVFSAALAIFSRGKAARRMVAPPFRFHRCFPGAEAAESRNVQKENAPAAVRRGAQT